MKIEVHNLRNSGHPFPIVAWLIMLLQRMNPFKKNSYSHMGLSTTNSRGETYFYDASFTGITKRTEEEFRKTYRTVNSCELRHTFSEVQFDSWFSLHSGKKYDFIQLLGLVPKLLKLKSTNHVGDDQNSLICCELVLLLLHKIKYFDMGDSDNYDLLETWKLSKERSKDVIS